MNHPIRAIPVNDRFFTLGKRFLEPSPPAVRVFKNILVDQKTMNIIDLMRKCNLFEWNKGLITPINFPKPIDGKRQEKDIFILYWRQRQSNGNFRMDPRHIFWAMEGNGYKPATIWEQLSLVSVLPIRLFKRLPKMVALGSFYYCQHRWGYGYPCVYWSNSRGEYLGNRAHITDEPCFRMFGWDADYSFLAVKATLEEKEKVVKA